MMLNANRELRQRVLIGHPVRQVRGGLLQIPENRRQTGGAKIPEVGAIHQMLHGAFRVRAVG